MSGSSAALFTPRTVTYPLARVSNWPWVPLDARGSSQSLRDKKEGQMWTSDTRGACGRGVHIRHKRGMWPRGVHKTEEGNDLRGAHQTDKGRRLGVHIRQMRGTDWGVVSTAEVWESEAWFGSTLQSGDLDILRQATEVPVGNVSNERKAASIIYSPQGLLGQAVPLRTYPVGSDIQSQRPQGQHPPHYFLLLSTSPSSAPSMTHRLQHRRLSLLSL